MSVIFGNIDSIEFSWHPGCHWDENTWRYSYGQIGRLGPGVTDAMIEERRRNHKKPPVPEALQLYIRLKDGSDPALFELIGDELRTYTDISINFINPMRLIRECKTKDEFVKMEESRKAEIAEKNRKIQEHIDALNALGVDTDEICGLNYEVEDEHQETTKEYYDVRSGRYDVCCRKGTQLYDGLAERGILEAVYPEWYAEGRY